MTMMLQKTNETPPLVRIMLFMLNTEKIHKSKIATYSHVLNKDRFIIYIIVLISGAAKILSNN